MSHNCKDKEKIKNDFWMFDTSKSEVKVDEMKYNHKAYTSEAVDYCILPFFVKKKRPDLYLGDKAISGSDYHNKDLDAKTAVSSPEIDKEKQKEKEKEKQKSLIGREDLDDDEENNHTTYDDLKNENRRYFSKDNITIKCFNCGEVGHMARSCNQDRIIHCYRCNEIGHTEYECPQFKCFKCNQLGHRASDCKVNQDSIIQCFRCNNKGHISADCLINPKKFKTDICKKIKCAFCGSKKHFVCPFKTDVSTFQVEDYDSDDVGVSEGEENQASSPENAHADDIEEGEEKFMGMKRSRGQIFDEIDNDEIEEAIFCYKCGDMHESKDCTVKTRENVFDIQRNRYQQKNADNHNNNSHSHNKAYRPNDHNNNKRGDDNFYHNRAYRPKDSQRHHNEQNRYGDDDLYHNKPYRPNDHKYPKKHYH